MRQKTIGITILSIGIVLTAIGFYAINAEDREIESSESVTTALSTEPAMAMMNEELAKASNNGQSNVEKGLAFEEYVISKLDFSRKSLTLLSRADNSARATMPDLDIKLAAGGKEYRFATECVWRKNMPHESLDWCREEKIEVLKGYEKKNNVKVFIVVGIGGNPRNPEQLYIVPFNERPYANIYTSVLQKYKVTTMEGKFFYEISTNTLTIK